MASFFTVWLVVGGISFSENNDVGNSDGVNRSSLPRKIQFLKEERELVASLITKLIRVYQLVFSPRQGEACNFTPSCSNYAYQAIEKYGLQGVIMGFDRLERCNYFAWQYKDKYYEVKRVPGHGYKLYDPCP